MGTIASEALAFVRESTEFGLLRVKMFRPFPRSAVKQVLDGKDLIVILERAYSLGGTPPLTSEILTTVEGARVVTFVVGIGGRDFTPKDVEELVSIAKQGKFRYAWYVGGEVRESY
jgi:pyruvate ferredoxin oxidoreductase alpha subunit